MEEPDVKQHHGMMYWGAIVAGIATLFAIIILPLFLPPTGSARNSPTFVHACSGVSQIEPDYEHASVLSCRRLIRGYITGYYMASSLNDMYAARDKENPVPRVFCVSDDVTDTELLSSVVEWTEHNQQATERVLNDHHDTFGALAIITKAIVEQYPCSSE